MSASEHSVVIVGSGAAGHACAKTLRAEGYEGSIRLVHGEHGPAIDRTLVDKGVLPGLLTAEQIALPPVAGVEVIDGRAVELWASTRTVVLDDGRELQGDALVLAPGSGPSALDEAVHLDAAVRLHFVHSVRDAEGLRHAVAASPGARIVILGAGFIGAAAASHFAEIGAQVTLVGRSRLPLRAAFGDEIAAHVAARHAEVVDARLGERVHAIWARAGAPDAAVVELDDRTRIEADVVVVAVGSRPATRWAGFEGPIAVDDRFRVPAAAGLYAVGSASAPEVDGVRMRVDHWDAAVTQGAHAARALLHDLGAGVDPGPWRPTSIFTLAAHGAVVVGRGARGADAVETVERVDGGGLLVRFSTPSGRLTGLAGLGPGGRLVRAASELTAAS